MTDSVSPRASVVVPAHNEGSVIVACLKALLDDAHPGEFEVVVVSNGSTDDTVTKAEAVLGACAASAVVSIPESSKIAALNRGDSLCSVYPRIYVDADIRMSTRALRNLVDVLRDTETARVAAPSIAVDTSRSSFAVRSYFRVWLALPYVTAGLIGSGVYAVNAAGGKRIGIFPDTLNDDAYVRGMFGHNERFTSQGHFIATAPANARYLVRRRARVEVGNRAVQKLVEGAGSSSSVASVVRTRSVSSLLSLDGAVYAAITIAAKVLARYRRARGTQGQWSTDTSSRESMPLPTRVMPS
ncbi:glycosyltransferase [Actinomycetes bacterium M1A6_2h]